MNVTDERIYTITLADDTAMTVKGWSAEVTGYGLGVVSKDGDTVAFVPLERLRSFQRIVAREAVTDINSAMMAEALDKRLQEAYQRGRKDENEACAKLCESFDYIGSASHGIARAIRKRCDEK